ncbi:ATP-dependent DNA ligase [Sinomonas sp. RB5]
MPAGRADALGGAFELALAKSVPTIPRSAGWLAEPKWDGYRVCAVVEHGRVRIFSRNGADLTPGFPELGEALHRDVPDGCVLDGEAVIWNDGRLDFDALQRRLGVGVALAARLAREAPASFVVFDVLAVLGRDVRGLPLRDRRVLLEQLAEGFDPPLALSPATADPAVARQWWDEQAHTGIEGLVLKPVSGQYEGGRRAWLKVKRRETIDLVCGAVIGPISHPSQLVLGWPDETGQLRIVGRTTALGSLQVSQAATILHEPQGTHPWPEEIPASRIDRFAKDRGPVHLTLVEPSVVEVSADAARSYGSFRHSLRLVRFRPDVLPQTVSGSVLGRPKTD